MRQIGEIGGQSGGSGDDEGGCPVANDLVHVIANCPGDVKEVPDRGWQPFNAAFIGQAEKQDALSQLCGQTEDGHHAMDVRREVAYFI